MKLRTKLVISFVTMIMIPTILTTAFIFGIARYQIGVIEHTYGITGEEYKDFAKSIRVLGDMPEIQQFIISACIAVVLILAFTAMIMMVWIYGSIISPIHKLQEAAQNVEEGNLNFEIKPEKDDDDSVTIGFSGSSGKSEVVGWVVCIEGSDKGTGFPLKTGRNFIGRNANQDIVLAKDRTVSRDKHAIIVYEPRQRKFIVQPGDSRGLFYLNDEVVLGSKELNAYDVILVGETKLAFIPFCGKKFSWDDGLHSEEE